MTENENLKTESNSSDEGLLSGMFNDNDNDERDFSILQERGYSNEEIDLVMSDITRKKYFFRIMTRKPK